MIGICRCWRLRPATGFRVPSVCSLNPKIQAFCFWLVRNVNSPLLCPDPLPKKLQFPPPARPQTPLQLLLEQSDSRSRKASKSGFRPHEQISYCLRAVFSQRGVCRKNSNLHEPHTSLPHVKLLMVSLVS